MRNPSWRSWQPRCHLSVHPFVPVRPEHHDRQLLATLKFPNRDHREAGGSGILARMLLRGVKHPAGLLAGAEHADDSISKISVMVIFKIYLII